MNDDMPSENHMPSGDLMPSENGTEYEENIPLSAKLGYGIATAGHKTLSGLGLGAIDVFYLGVYGLDPSWMILSWALFMVWNAINDPLIGILQERTKTKIGRRIPYLRYGWVPYSLSFILIWFPFLGMSEFGLFINHLLMLFIFDTLYSMTGLITYSLPAEMAVTSKERNSIIFKSAFIGVFGMLMPMILQGFLFNSEVPNKEFIQVVMVITGIVSGLLIFISSYLIKENEYTLREETLGFVESFRQTMKNKPFLILEIVLFNMVIIQEIIFSEISFLFNYLIKLNGLVSLVFAAPMFMILFLSFIWMNRNLERQGMKKTTIVGSLFGLIGYSMIFFVGIFNKSKITIEQNFIGLGLVLSSLVIFFLIQQNLLGEVIDYDEIRTGKRRETTYSGVNALFTKPAVSIAHGLFLFIIVFFDYDKDIKNPKFQSPNVSTGVLFAFTIIPIICLIIAIFAMRFYPLEGEDWTNKKKEIREIHLQKEKEYVKSL